AMPAPVKQSPPLAAAPSSPASLSSVAASPAAASAPIRRGPCFAVRTPDRNYGPARLPGGMRVTPLARRLAAQGGIDLAGISPSGPHSRTPAPHVRTPAGS